MGADDGIRTRDLRFTKPLLYQLSYVGAETERGQHAIRAPSCKPERPEAIQPSSSCKSGWNCANYFG
jgi:hypothetical protein